MELGQSSALQTYIDDFESCYSPMTSDSVAKLHLLRPDSWQAAYKPDEYILARQEWASNGERGTHGRDEILAERLRRAKQDGSIPRVFLHSPAQLNPDLYPWQSLSVDSLLYEGAYGMPGTFDSTKRLELDYFYGACYFRQIDWMSCLPVPEQEEVYVARSASFIFVTTWGDFTRRWDGFHADRFCAVNICDDSNEWFLMMHPERFCIFGCTEERAADFAAGSTHRIIAPIDYRKELDRQREEFDIFRNDLKANYPSRQSPSTD